jgi:pilus assembly protein TadC
MFFPITYKQIQKLFRPCSQQLRALLALYPDLETDLEQAEIEATPELYIGGAILSSILLSALILSFTLMIIGIARPDMITEKNILLITGFTLLFMAIIYNYIMLIPHWKALQRAAKIEKDLLFAIRHLAIQTNAGVPLFAAMVSIAEERGPLGYGIVSEEFGRIVKEVQSGYDLSQALENSAMRVKSKYYNRIMWQLANSNRAGVPVNKALSALLDYLSEEQRIALRKYGNQLSPLALMYLLVTIVGPTLGLIFLMIASTLISLPLTGVILDGLLVTIVFVQIFFLGLIQSRRPTISI